MLVARSVQLGYIHCLSPVIISSIVEHEENSSDILVLKNTMIISFSWYLVKFILLFSLANDCKNRNKNAIHWLSELHFCFLLLNIMFLILFSVCFPLLNSLNFILNHSGIGIPSMHNRNFLFSCGFLVQYFIACFHCIQIMVDLGCFLADQSSLCRTYVRFYRFGKMLVWNKNNLMDGGKMKLCCHSVKNKVIMMKKIIATR